MAPDGWLQAIATAILRNVLRFLCKPLIRPPMQIQVGSDEILLDDAVTLQEFAGLWHVFQNHAGILAVSDRATHSLADFAAAP